MPELRIPIPVLTHHHLRLRLTARKFKLLNDVRYFLEPMCILILHTLITVSIRLACEITRKVVRSNMMTSSASHSSQNLERLFSRFLTFGMRDETIEDHALYSVSSYVGI